MTRRARTLLAGMTSHDGLLLAAVLVLSALGLIVVYSAGSFQGRHSTDYLVRHAVRLAMGIIIMFWLAGRDLERIRRREIIWGLLGISLLLLSLTILLRHTAWVGDHASHARWLRLPFFPVQPVELLKVTLVLFLAERCSGGFDRLRRRRERWLPVVLVPLGGIVILVLQPNFSNALVLLLLTVLLLWLSGMPTRWLLPAAAVVVLGGVLGYRFSGKIHHRLDVWWQGVRCVTEEYQVRQGLISLGAGGVTGRGIGGSRQRLAFLPESQTDYVFAVAGEEMGLAGTLLIVFSFVVVAWRGYKIAGEAGSRFGMLLAAGTTTLLVLYALLNIGMVTALLPVLGVPLPLLSYGGSALVTNLAAVGLLLCVGRANRSDRALRQRVNRRQ